MLESDYQNYVTEIEVELKNDIFKMDDKTLVYFSNNLDDCDIFLLLLTAVLNNPLFTKDLKKYDELITFSTRNCLKSFTRLVAMGLLQEHRGIKNAVSYTVTYNGRIILDFLRKFGTIKREVVELGKKIGTLINKEENVNE